MVQGEESIHWEYKAKGTTAILAQIISKFAREAGFALEFLPRRSDPRWSPPTPHMRRFGAIHKVDDAKRTKMHPIGRIELQQLPDDICVVSIESKEFLDRVDELEAFHVALYEHLEGRGLYLGHLRAHTPA